MRIATIGAAFSGNKGAASMLHAVVDRVGRRAPDARIDVHSTYAPSDRPVAPEGVDIVDAPPWRLPLVELPLALLARSARALRIPQAIFLRTAALRSLAEADVVVDMAGISFVDSRKPHFVVYNAMADVVPLLLGTPVVKCAQAMGPFERRVNRALARVVLPRLESIQARGARTEQHLRSLGVATVERSADLAFTLHEDLSDSPLLDGVLERAGGRPVVAVMPSAVVARRCDTLDVDYVGTLAKLVDHLTGTLHAAVVIAPHSYRASGRPARMHDGGIVEDLARRIGSGDHVIVVNEDCSPGDLRRLIGASSMLVTSRFHAMISGLATATPTLVIGWSHKYEEVLADFGLQRLALPYEQARDAGDLVRAADDLWRERAAVSRQIAAALPGVQALAEGNYRAIGEVCDVELTTDTTTERVNS